MPKSAKKSESRQIFVQVQVPEYRGDKTFAGACAADRPSFCWRFKKDRILQTGAGDHNAAIGAGRNDRCDDAANGMATAFGTRFSCWRGAQAAQLNLNSMKVDGNRVYRIDQGVEAEATGKQPSAAQPEPTCLASKSARRCRMRGRWMSRSLACAISTSVVSRSVGRTCFGGDRPLTCPAISCFAFWPIGCRPIGWATLMPKAGGCSMQRIS